MIKLFTFIAILGLVYGSAHQCEYNGQKYDEGQEIAGARKLCLNCICSKDFIEPSDYNCTVIQCQDIEPLSQGCMPIYSDTECCPIDWDCTTAQPLVPKCDKRYLKHYDAKGCTPVYESDLDCPAYYNCPDNKSENKSVCVFKGKTYQRRERIDDVNPCKICSCIDVHAFSMEIEKEVEINCIFMECPQIFLPPLNDTCYNVYQADKCCPVDTKCNTDESSQITEKVCEYKGKTYHYGEKIYPEENECQICFCNEQWTGVNGNSCRIHDCDLELKKEMLQKGCVPIYHEKACCPIQMYCGTKEEGYQNTTVPFADKSDIDSGKTCVFKGTHYKLGQTLDINHPTNCVTCTCITPPDFTCVHKSCPHPPNDDYENCESIYVPGQCCPTYDCKKLSASAPVPIPQCSPVLCPEGCSEVTVHNSCPFCRCQEKICAPPKCDDACTPQTNVSVGECPGCDCPEKKSALLCSPVKCPPYCFEVYDPQGCPMCMCGPICTPPKCEPGCEIQRDVPDGECPKCSCPTDPDDKIHCAPVLCLPGCTKSIGESGCPSCVCKPLCSPPKCDDPCYLNPFPTGPCPECVCDDKESVPQLLCSPVNCGPLCHEAYDGDGCPTCICDPMCTIPVCEQECELDYSPNTGPCPTCVCKKTCPIVTCGPMCEKQIGSDGCPTCFCSPLCSPPKCEANCHLEYDRATGSCPSCVCSKYAQCSPVKCDDNCIEAIGDNGCPMCICNPQCSPPKCEVGCEVRLEQGPCPTCECFVTSNIPLIQCSPPKCDGEGCRIDYDSEPCPSCVCEDAVIPLIQCSPPKCDSEGCYIDYDSEPCPSCVCEETIKATFQCSPPKCDLGCHIDFTAKPCPTCVCGSILRKSPFTRVRCGPLKCPEGCKIDYTSKPCPRCACDNRVTESPLTRVRCGTLKCPDGCELDYNSKPCPRCACENKTIGIEEVQCSPVKCDLGCWPDYSTEPCPSCTCDSDLRSKDIICTPPKCAAGCRLNYDARPCPRCVCDDTSSGLSRIQCSPLKCSFRCYANYTAKPCPRCDCDNKTPGIPEIMCSQPVCDTGCHIDYSSKPCPSCTCDQESFTGIPRIMCSPPKCEVGCSIDFSTLPCPSCKCDTTGLGIPSIMCSPPKCDDPGCTIDYSSKPCPSCTCDALVSGQKFCAPVKCAAGCTEINTGDGCPVCDCKPLCSMPKCGLGCRIDYNAEPCPACVCDRYLRRFSPLQHTQWFPTNIYTGSNSMCGGVKCGSGCVMEQFPSGEDRCPMCSCDVRGGEKIKCLAMRCELPCRFERFSAHGCPTCICHPIPCPVINCGPTTIEEKLPEDRCPKCVPSKST